MERQDAAAPFGLKDQGRMVLVAMRQVSSPAQRRDEWRLPEPEPPPREHKLDTAPIGWVAEIDRRIAVERELHRELLAHVIAELRAESTDDLERATRSLTVELGELRGVIAELRCALVVDRAKVLDLPALPRRELN